MTLPFTSCTPPDAALGLGRFAAGSTLGPTARTSSTNNRPSTLASLIATPTARDAAAPAPRPAGRHRPDLDWQMSVNCMYA